MDLKIARSLVAVPKDEEEAEVEGALTTLEEPVAGAAKEEEEVEAMPVVKGEEAVAQLPSLELTILVTKSS